MTEPNEGGKLPGTIDDYLPEDRMGWLRLEDGRRVEFGRSACIGFEPFAKLRVGAGKVVRDASGAWCAHELTLSSHPEKAVRSLLDPVRAASGDVFSSGLAVTVVLERPFPSGAEGWKAVLNGALWERSLKVVGDELFWNSHHMLSRASRGALSTDALDLRHLPHGFSLGEERLTLVPTVIPLLGLRLSLGSDFPDPWAATGLMRTASRIVSALLHWGGRAVVLPSAGGLVFGKEDFLRRLGDLENLESRPFGAWVDWALIDNRQRYQSVGMELLGGRDVEVSILHRSSDVELDSAEAAVLYACMLQVRENRLLEEGEVLYVPKDIRVGALGASAKSTTGYKYTAQLEGAHHLLERC